MTDPKIVANAQQFLGRADLKGHEVPAFVEVSNWLHAISVERKAQHDAAAGSSDKES
jgi:hypothetical protein